MEARPRVAGSWGERLGQIGPGLALGAGLFAYWPLLHGAFRPPGDYRLEGWFFRPAELPTLLVLATASWLLWRRRGRLAALPPAASWRAAAPLLAVGTAFFVWAILTRAADLFLPSLAANLLGLAAAARGRPGCRAVLLPAIVLVVGLRLPAPLLNELVWKLQLWTASGASWLLEAVGRNVLRAGVVLHFEGQTRTFQVIEGCSGLRGIEILTLVALIVRELFGASERRLWLLLVIAPVLGHGLNMVRIALIAGGPDAEAFTGAQGGHTSQGLAVLMAGTGLLYGLGWLLSGRPDRHRDPRGTGRAPLRPAELPWRAAAAWLAVLGALTLWVSPFSAARRAPDPRPDLPLRRAGWQGEDIEPDPLFTGPLYTGRSLYRRYVRTPRDAPRSIVEVFVAYNTPEIPVTSRLLSSKLGRPGADWSIERHRSMHLAVLGQDVDLALAYRPLGPAYAVMYHWLLRDEGLGWEALRSLLALDSSPFRPSRPRTVVRLVTPVAHGGPLVRDRGRRILDHFISDFRAELSDL